MSEETREITYLYLTSGEEVVANVVTSEDSPVIALHDPRRLMLVPQQGESGQQGFGMSMLPWPLVGKNNPTITLDKSVVLFQLTGDAIDDNLKTQYLQMITNLIIPGAGGMPPQNVPISQK